MWPPVKMIVFWIAFGIGLTKQLAMWPFGQGVWLGIRRLWIWVSSWVCLFTWSLPYNLRWFSCITVLTFQCLPWNHCGYIQVSVTFLEKSELLSWASLAPLGWLRGLMDKASDYGSEDWGFESLRCLFSCYFLLFQTVFFLKPKNIVAARTIWPLRKYKKFWIAFGLGQTTRADHVA